jgi:ABC-type cobalamin/Fe3+-siderophores transport system ATPase subunit
VFCLLGANGAGKTATINLFLNFIEPTGATGHRSIRTAAPSTAADDRSAPLLSPAILMQDTPNDVAGSAQAAFVPRAASAQGELAS